MTLEDLLTREPLRRHDGVLDFLSDADADYCANFGLQWELFHSVQLDSRSGGTESHDRFFSETGWKPDELSGKVLLDVGCGAGRFAEVAAEHGARVVAVDLSEAVWACRRTLLRFPPENVLVLRADLANLPLKRGSFDGVYALGVLQHTPDPLDALASLAAFVRPGGRLATWIYEVPRPDVRPLLPKTWLRHLTAGANIQTKLVIAAALTTLFFPLGWALSRCGRPGALACNFLPYAARHGNGHGNLRRQWTYSVMDTLDWYGPVYDQPQREQDVVEAMRAAGLSGVRRLSARGMAVVGEAP
jgi:SAM-dependent methyltransferase